MRKTCSENRDHYNATERNEAEAAKWYRFAALQSMDRAQYELGVMYENRWGVSQDFSEAVKWYRLAAAQKHADAETRLGIMYANGRGVPQDDKEAIKWFRLAAAQGNALAQLVEKLGREAHGRGLAGGETPNLVAARRLRQHRRVRATQQVESGRLVE